MNNSKALIAILIVFACLFLGWRKHQEPVQGVAVLKTRIWDEKLNKYVKPKRSTDMKIWYRDSLLIYHTRSKIADASGNTPFVNLVGKTLDIYHFRNGPFGEWQYFDFAAPAPVKQASSMNETYGWSVKRLVTFPFGDDLSGYPMESLPDTVIDGVYYKRVKNESIRFENNPDADEYAVIGYLRCDKKGLPFGLSKEFDAKMGCMLTRIEYRIKNVSPWFLIEIEFQHDRLSDNEQAIFDSWQKNAKEDSLFSMKENIPPPGPIPVRDTFSFCGVKYKIPRDCKGKSQANCCSASTSPDQLGCYNGTHLSWDYLPTMEIAKLNFESIADQLKSQMSDFRKKTIDCFFADTPVKAYQVSARTHRGDPFHCILAYGTVNGQPVMARLSSQKKLKKNKDIQAVFRQIIRLKE